MSEIKFEKESLISYYTEKYLEEANDTLNSRLADENKRLIVKQEELDQLVNELDNIDEIIKSNAEYINESSIYQEELTALQSELKEQEVHIDELNALINRKELILTTKNNDLFSSAIQDSVVLLIIEPIYEVIHKCVDNMYELSKEVKTIRNELRLYQNKYYDNLEKYETILNESIQNRNLIAAEIKQKNIELYNTKINETKNVLDETKHYIDGLSDTFELVNSKNIEKITDKINDLYDSEIDTNAFHEVMEEMLLNLKAFLETMETKEIHDACIERELSMLTRELADIENNKIDVVLQEAVAEEAIEKLETLQKLINYFEKQINTLNKVFTTNRKYNNLYNYYEKLVKDINALNDEVDYLNNKYTNLLNKKAVNEMSAQRSDGFDSLDEEMNNILNVRREDFDKLNALKDELKQFKGNSEYKSFIKVYKDYNEMCEVLPQICMKANSLCERVMLLQSTITNYYNGKKRIEELHIKIEQLNNEKDYQ